MKKIILGVLLFVSTFGFAQVRYVHLEASKGEAVFADLKDATLHVVIKDFCDDSKPYKKIMEENWKHSKLSFDYEEKFDMMPGDKVCQEGEWYMFLERSMGSTPGAQRGENYSNFMNTNIIVAKCVGKRGKMDYVVEMPIFPAPGKDKKVGYPYSFLTQNLDVATCFLNLSNEFYLASTLNVLNQFVEKKVSKWRDFDNDISCESLKEVLNSTLFIPQYVLLESSKYKDSQTYVPAGEFMKGYEAKYKIASNEEIKKKFKSGETFYYLLYSAGYGKWNFIVEGKTGKLISASGDKIGYNIDKGDMGALYEHLKNNKTCK